MCLVSLAVKKSFMATSLSVCVDYMQYILSYCSCFCPLSSLCSISSVGEVGVALRARGGQVNGTTDIPKKKDDNPLSLFPHLFLHLPLSAVLVKPVEVRGISCSVAFAKNGKKICRVHLLFRCFLFVFVKLCSFIFLTLLSICYCFLLLCSLIQTSLSRCLFSQR